MWPLSTETIWGLVLAGGGAVLGLMAAKAWRRRMPKPASPDQRPLPPEDPKQESRRFFLLNETGNVLISTSLSPTGPLPDTTLALFSEALAHLATVFYAVSGATDPATGEPFSLYHYGALKRALDAHPFFIRMSRDEPKPARASILTVATPPQPQNVPAAPTNSAFSRAPRTPPQPETAKESQTWLEDRVDLSLDALGMDASPAHVRKLRTIHTQMMVEANRLQHRPKPNRTGPVLFASGHPSASPSGVDQGETEPAADAVEVGHITLYCECLMGVSLVSVKLAHATCDDYLNSASLMQMEYDTYLYVSPSQLKKSAGDLGDLPRVKLGS